MIICLNSCEHNLTINYFQFGGTSSNAPSSEPSAKLNSDVVLALTHIVLSVGSASDMHRAIIQALESTGTDWAASLDRRQVLKEIYLKYILFWFNQSLLLTIMA